MPSWLRVLLIIFLVFAMIIAAAGVIGYRWWTNNKGRLMEAAKHAQSDGEAFGRGKDANACIDEGLAQVRECGGLPCELKVRLFVDGCMHAADTHDFCASVPKQSEFIKHAEWTINECRRRGMQNDQRCTRVMDAASVACNRAEASK